MSRRPAAFTEAAGVKFSPGYLRWRDGDVKIDGRIAANKKRAKPVVRRTPEDRRASIVALLPPDIVEQGTAATTFVYFAKCGARIKIGFTKNIRQRMKALQTGLSEQIEVVFALRGGKVLEAHLHAMFKSQRLHGEWFSFGGNIQRFLNAMPTDWEADVRKVWVL